MAPQLCCDGMNLFFAGNNRTTCSLHARHDLQNAGRTDFMRGNCCKAQPPRCSTPNQSAINEESPRRRVKPHERQETGKTEAKKPPSLGHGCNALMSRPPGTTESTLHPSTASCSSATTSSATLRTWCARSPRASLRSTARRSCTTTYEPENCLYAHPGKNDHEDDHNNHHDDHHEDHHEDDLCRSFNSLRIRLEAIRHTPTPQTLATWTRAPPPQLLNPPSSRRC
jgi:hypothetical protein